MRKQRHYGFSLIEMMISLTIAMIISIGIMYIYSGQTRTFYQVARKQQTTQETAAAFEIITGLLHQAEICLSSSCSPQQTIAITYPAGVTNPNATTVLQAANDSINVAFTVPSGYYIWPNATAPYTNNTINLSWNSTDGILYAQAGTQPAVALAGATGNMNTRIVNFDVWPMVTGATGVPSAGATATDKPTAGYRLVLTARIGAADTSYTNPLDPTGALKNYRTVTYENVILPRNW